jgi:hypothetical protein
MPWTSNLVRRLLKRAVHGERRPMPPAEQSDDDEDRFAEILAASSILDFGGLPVERRSDEAARVRDLHLGLRPW